MRKKRHYEIGIIYAMKMMMIQMTKEKRSPNETAHLSKCLQILRRQCQRIALTDYTTSHDESQLRISNKAKINRGVLDKEDLGLLCALERTEDGEEELA